MSKVEVNEIDKQSGSTLTLGGSGTAVTLACGATQTGFGRTGTVDWQTSIKTSTFTAANGEGYFVNTTGGAITANLPAGTAGSIVAFKDYLGTFDNNALTVAANGSQKINGAASPDLTVNAEGESLTLVYADDTQGWLVVNDGNTDAGSQATFISASGGTETTVCTNFKVHTFTGPGTFTVSSVGNAEGSNSVDYLVIGGGAAGGGHGGDGSTVGGGGGAGGYRFSNGTVSGCYTAGPAPLGATALPVTATGFPITVGAGGVSAFPGNTAPGSQGSNSIFSTIISAGGGGGNGSGMDCAAKGNGGSGGGGRAYNSTIAGGSGNTPPVSPPQGNDGGDGNNPKLGGGGGGAGGAGSPGASPLPANNGRGGGGIGLTSCITASPVTRGGGGGGANSDTSPNGGSGGGGAGPESSSGGIGAAGTVNTGGGGGGGPHGNPSPTANGGAGGSGIVIIRYKFQ